MRASKWRPCVLALIALLAAARRLNPPGPGLGAPTSCAQAQLIQGELRCGPELLRELPARCGAPSRALGPGDAIEPRVCLCAAAAGLRQLGLGCADSPVLRMPPDQLAALEQRVDLNHACAAELASLPGIGPALAGRIIAGRPHASVEALREIAGIGDKRFAAPRPRAHVEPRSAQE